MLMMFSKFERNFYDSRSSRLIQSVQRPGVVFHTRTDTEFGTLHIVHWFFASTKPQVVSRLVELAE